jgi:hypothetical protein
MKGTKATELPTFAKESLRNDVSQRIARAAKATRPFQLVVEESLGKIQGLATSSHAAAADIVNNKAKIR